MILNRWLEGEGERAISPQGAKGVFNVSSEVDAIVPRTRFSKIDIHKCWFYVHADSLI